MNLGLRTFLAGIVDYAGLFPPARLPLEQAIRAYVRYTREDEAWMLGRFVCPAGRLSELTPLDQELFVGVPVLFSALGRGGATTEEFLTGLGADLDAVSAFRETHGSGVDVDDAAAGRCFLRAGDADRGARRRRSLDRFVWPACLL